MLTIHTKTMAMHLPGSIILLLIFLFHTSHALAASQLQARAAVEKQEVFQGESFLFQIQVEGDDSPQEPDLAAIQDFQIQPRGGQSNSSQSITIVNGRMERQTRHGYIFNYQLTPKRVGRLNIPSLSVNAGGQTLRTEAIPISVKKPMETEEFKLRIDLGANSAYVGETVPLTVTWYISSDVKGFDFNLPMLDDQRFTVAPITPEIPQNQANRFLKIPLGNNREAIAEKGEGQLEGRSFTTIRMKFVLIPKEAGRLAIPQGTVTCQVSTGRRSDRFNDPFGRFFQDDLMDDFFGRGRGGKLSTVVAPSNEPQLSVKLLPEAGRPQNFSGLVGEYSLHADASPTEVNVGDPITLTVAVTGPEYLDNVTLPALETISGFSEGFRIPNEMAPGERKAHEKIFTQTIRAKDPAVKSIPPVTLSFFNPRTGTYDSASSSAIPLTVRAAKVITAEDAVGATPSPTATSRQKVTQLDRGIAHNYEDSSVLATEIPRDAAWHLSKTWWLVLLLPPGLFFVAGGAWLAAKRRDPVADRAKRAYSELTASVKRLEALPPSEGSNALTTALHDYLRARLVLPPGALTAADISTRLQKRGIPEATQARLTRVLENCEATRYAGAVLGEATGWQSLATEILGLAQEIEKSI